MIKNDRRKKFKDISFDLTKNIVTNDLKVLTNSEAIKNSVKNLVLTKIGERLLNKYIGTRIGDYLFELNIIFVSSEIKSEIRNVINTFEPRVRLKNIRLESRDNTIVVFIEYLITGEQAVETLEFILLRES